MDGFVEFYHRGGVFMHWIAALTLVGACVFAERAWHLVLTQGADARRLFRLIQGRLLAADTASALALCEGRGVVARIVRAGLMAGTDPARARAAVEEERTACVSMLMRRISILGSLASLAALVGLLGTVDGMVGGFQCGAMVTAEARAAALGREIACALNTTGFGLGVALLLRAVQAWLRDRSEALVGEVELYGARVANLVAAATEPQPSSSAAPYRNEPLGPW